ncbi:MAG: CDP-diacylglycerol--glycerol-3-phosphate 3-phosphatidyltransferase [Clostridiales Family XIII bacterium]|jgi:CDP-diacylglycerol--glycerol-3-phosphate 3-phosphatidyltransferase/cardiolipin synthase|nr:CDP-diacylglycerol--glycerol-3-phosphate 3-phosphatidyltransferase [Clostridiales Family XIII bacterium]
MNLPNFLTLIRMALVPVFIVLFYFGQTGSRAFCLLAFAVFAIASATDALDGHIARKHGLITNFGKLMDPLADKVLTTSAFIVFVDVGIVPAWMVVVILAREFAITGLRGVAAAEGVVIAAGFSGKLKTIFQMLAICLILLDSAIGNGPATHSLWLVVSVAGLICLWVAVALTVYSGIEYLWKGRNLLNMK